VASAVGLPHPNEASTAAGGNSPVWSTSYNVAPKFTSAGIVRSPPQQLGLCAATAAAA
jgi:hypothetical protein